MIKIEGKTVFHKLWFILQTYILTLERYDLFLEGSLLIVLLLDANCYHLLERDVALGNLPARIQDWMIMGAAGAEFLFGAALAWMGRGRRQYSLSFWLGVTAISGLVVLAFPYVGDDVQAVELCGGSPISSYSTVIRTSEDNPVPRIVFLCLTLVLCALTRISIWSHGLTYLDDHEPQNGPYFYGILISIRLSLGLSGKGWLVSSSRTEDWWKTQVSVAMLTFMFAILYLFFPRKMSKYNTKAFEEKGEGFVSTMYRLLRNKTLMLQTGAMTLFTTGLYGFIRYEDNFVQARYQVETEHEDPRTSTLSGDIFRSLVIIFFVAVFRVRFSVRRSDAVKSNTAAKVGGVVAILATVFFVVVAILGCNASGLACVDDGSYGQPQCSSNCGCNSERYGFTPVCDVTTMTSYFSPCHAGCSVYEDLNQYLMFTNCSCSAGARVVRGSCELPSCSTFFSVYQILFAVILAFSGASLLMQAMSILRSVAPPDKPLALGLSYSLIGLIAHVPGHLLFMLISHLTCAYAVDGACLYHNATIWIVPVVSAAFTMLSAISSITIGVMSKGTSNF